MTIFDRSEAAMSAGSAAHVAKAAISLSAVLRRACSRGWPLLARSHCLLLALVVAAVDMAPLQVQAQAGTSKTIERGVNGKQSNQTKNFDQIKIIGAKKQITQALQDIYSTKVGKEFFGRIPLEGLTIEGSSLEGIYGLYKSNTKKILLPKKFFSDKRYSSNVDLSIALFCELQHYAQDCEGRYSNRAKGIEGYADFVIGKLNRVESKLFETVYLAELGPKKSSEQRDQVMAAQYYRELEEKYQRRALNEEEVSRKARTEYVQVLWEYDRVTGPGFFDHWYWFLCGDQIEKECLGQSVGERDIQKEYDMIQGYIKAMGIDLGLDYFFDTKKWRLSHKGAQELDKRESKCAKRGTCLQLYTPKARNAVATAGVQNEGREKQVVKFDAERFDRIIKGLKITNADGNGADAKRRDLIMKALQDIYSTKTGKDLLDGLSLESLRIKFNSQALEDRSKREGKNHRVLACYCEAGKGVVLSDDFTPGGGSSAVLLHELHHYAQDLGGRLNCCATEGYADFVLAKLTEVESKLFEILYLAEKGPSDSWFSDHTRACVEYYKGLEEKYREETQDED